MNSSSPPPPIRKYLLLFLGLAGFCFSLTILYLCMRAVLNIGGYCAEGGPYEIQVHCPKATAYLAPLSIFGMFIFGFTYFINNFPNVFNFTIFFWTALFGSLGWNFLDFSLQSFKRQENNYSWLICAIIFFAMALGPVLLINQVDVSNFISNNSQTNNNNYQKILLLAYEIIAIIFGIWLGIILFNKLSY